MSIIKRLLYPLNRFLAHRRLSKLYQETLNTEGKIIRFGPDDKFILFSDCHRGDNSWKDDYAPNRHLHMHALSFYLQRGFTYIELGDGDELFEISDFAAIAYAHRDVFYLMREFYCDPPPTDAPAEAQYSPKEQSRLHLLYGNHDIQRRSAQKVKADYEKFHIEYKDREDDMFPGITIHESLMLQYGHRSVRKNIFLVHGHQGDWFNDHLWWLALVVVRFIWGPLQQTIGWRDPTMPAKPYNNEKWGVQQRIKEWLAKEKKMLICGHTHQSYFASPLEPAHYFNAGSCVHPRAITGIEIEDGKIALIKWEMLPRRADGVLHIEREVLVGPVPIENYQT
jgi:predicted phosphodiesterase